MRNRLKTVAALCIASQSATAGVTGITTEVAEADQSEWATPETERTLFTVSLYAEFDNPADELLAVSGQFAEPLDIATTGPAGFYQCAANASADAFNTSNDINASLAATYPSLQADSFVTIGRTDSTDNTLSTIGFEFDGFNNDGRLYIPSQGTWFLYPGADQGVAGSHPDQRVLIGRFTVDRWTSLNALVHLHWRDAGGDIQTTGGHRAVLRIDTCIADLPGEHGFCDGEVNVEDALRLIAAWGEHNPQADVDGDFIITTDDLLIVLSQWGSCN